MKTGKMLLKLRIKEMEMGNLEKEHEENGFLGILRTLATEKLKSRKHNHKTGDIVTVYDISHVLTHGITKTRVVFDSEQDMFNGSIFLAAGN